MFICTELIEKLEDPKADFWHVGILLDWLGQVRVLEKILTFDGVMTYDVRNLKYANSSSNYYVIMMVQNLKK